MLRCRVLRDSIKIETRCLARPRLSCGVLPEPAYARVKFQTPMRAARSDKTVRFWGLFYGRGEKGGLQLTSCSSVFAP